MSTLRTKINLTVDRREEVDPRTDEPTISWSGLLSWPGMKASSSKSRHGPVVTGATIAEVFEAAARVVAANESKILADMRGEADRRAA